MAGLPGDDVVFRLWQCDKENHGWREGAPLTVHAKTSICGWAFTLSAKSSYERKKNTPTLRRPRALHHNIGWFKRPGRRSGIPAPGFLSSFMIRVKLALEDVRIK